MFLSVIIPSIGRESLKRAVESVIRQDFNPENFEVIVISQGSFNENQFVWTDLNPNFKLVSTRNLPLSVARNTGAALARGEYLYFLDDDDWMLPGVISAFHQAVEIYPEAGLIYGGCEFRAEDKQLLGMLNLGKSGNCLPYLLTGAWIPAQSEIIKTRVFFEIAGFDPLARVGEEDDLNCRVSLHYDLVNIEQNVVGILRGKGWKSSIDYSISVENLRKIRDRTINHTASFNRLRYEWDDPYWMGRVFRINLASVRWNLRRKRYLKALSRSLFSLRYLFAFNSKIVKTAFWKGFKDHHPTQSAALSFTIPSMNG